MNPTFLETARLLVQIAPVVFATDRFALKGGTAINLFYRDMPRLSVDLDLAYRDHAATRANALAAISSGLQSIASQLVRRGLTVHIPISREGATKLLTRKGSISVKIEVNTVIRGTVYPDERRSLAPRAGDRLMAELEIPLASFADTYGGKLVAALDRQHPRDLFDVMTLLAMEGITPEIRRAFVVYAASHNRPLHEVLAPAEKDISFAFRHHFVGMTSEPVSLDALLEARRQLMQSLPAMLDVDERSFLLSFASPEPEWDRLGIAHLAELPAIKWKRQNLEKLRAEQPAKFAAQQSALAEVLKR